MAKEYLPKTIGAFPVERVQVGKHTLGHVVIDDDLSVVFKAKSDEDEWKKAANCMLCVMQESRPCRDKVCPPGTNDCSSEVIKACVDAACRGKCPSFDGGDYMIAAY
jgi:hypothetical protein